MLLRIKDLVAQMADEVDLPVSGNFDHVPARALSPGARELAFACAYLVMDQDRALVNEEAALASTLAVELGLEGARSQELITMIDRLVESAT